MTIVTLLTDFGTADGYAAAMKGVIISEQPNALVIDATHDIPRHDVRAGAWALRHYWKLYPEGTIHVAVVDPGVGSARRALIACADGRWLVGPDNGLFSWALRESRSSEVRALKGSIRRHGAIGNTFHGRDVFAYVAGKLASRTPLRDLAGPRITPICFDWPRPYVGRTEIRGCVVHIDRFGNAITNIRASDLKRIGARAEIGCEGFHVRGISKFYSEVAKGKPVALTESTGLLELAVRDGDAASQNNISIGSVVSIKR